jgi:ATP-dependent DNA helicase DinG
MPESADPAAAPADGLAGLAHLASVLPGFEARPGQRQMTAAVAHALATGTDLVVEAGTGTGKTLAYLVPVLQQGKRALLSTATRQLQTQIVEHDLPLAQRAAGTSRAVAVLKGRSNYLCRQRIGQFRLQKDRAGQPIPPELLLIEKKAQHSEFGDRNEVRGVDELSPIWPEVTSTTDNCLGSQCPHIDDCFVVQARRRAAAADLVVVNHHLLLADYAVRERWEGARLLQGIAAYVIDEAHALADVATSFFGVSLSERRLHGVTKDLRAGLKVVTSSQLAGALQDALGHLELAAEQLWQALGQLGHLAVLRPDRLRQVRPAVEALTEALQVLQDLAGDLTLAHEPVWQKAVEALHLLGNDVQDCLPSPELAVADDTTVRWLELRPRDTVVLVRPIDVAPILRRTLLAESAVRIFTSATLTAGGQFDHTRRQLGLAASVRTLLLPGAFDYPKQALLYVPRDLPDPSAPGRDAAVAAEVERLAFAAAGGVLALFSSHRAMREAATSLRQRLPFAVLLQGEDAKERLLQRYVQSQPAVLLATLGFWQGVDLPAEALRVVVLDKIPFPPPDEPLFVARSEWLEREGRSSFASLSLPQATIALRQGFGRLIRSNRHYGVVALLDPRLHTKSYGRQLLASLPPAGRTQRFEEVAAFLSERAEGQ